MASLVFLLQPYCGFVDAAEAAPAAQQDEILARAHAPQDDTCLSLDHTPVALPDAGLPPVVDAPAKLSLAGTAEFSAITGTDSRAVTPRATPPPFELFPLYLRYAHLLI